MALDDPMLMMLSRTEREHSAAEVLLQTLALQLTDELSAKHVAVFLKSQRNKHP